jgi:hypothetical protein
VSNNTVQVIETKNSIQIVNETTVVEIPHIEQRLEVTTPGPQGRRGAEMLSGATNPPPPELGITGDYYFLTQEPYYIYGPKTESGWPAEPFFQATGLTRRNIYTQGSASSTWTITHDLGGYPSVTVVNSTGTVVVGTVTYNSTSEIQIEFTAPFSGTAYLT